MLLDEKEAIAVQLVKVSAEELTAKTEDNQLITIKADKKQRADKSFWRILKDIAKEKIWVPVTRGTHQLLQDDWLVPVTG
ncbi:hypothetical protein GPK34_10915 [Secundilactobacillus kimchicus]|nr:hypothetical protein [Secundilactobacillus kimchicus]MBT9672535.1 hypothetical protein [Secundilactobacillus kimchicus]